MADTHGAGERHDHSWFGERIQGDTGRIETPENEADVIRILRDPARYPSPVRPVGSRHSMTPCMSAMAPDGTPAHWGTLVDMTGLTRFSDGSSLRIETRGGETTITVPAGRTFIDVAREVRERGLQFRVNPEIGPITMGAAACGATKDSSFPGESGQVCRDVVGMRLVRPDGKPEELREGDPDFDALRCSYGLFGIVTEVTCRVFPPQYISLRHESIRPRDGMKFTAAELGAHFRKWIGGNRAGEDENAVFLYLFPYRDRIAAEIRRKPASDGTPKEWSLRLEIRNHFWDMGSHSWERFARMTGTPLKRRLQDLFGRILRWYLAHVLHLEKVNPVAQIVDFEKGDKEHRFTFSMWAFPEDEFPEILLLYFGLCRKHEAAFRSGLPHASYHIGQDTSSPLSYSRRGAVWTLDPISPENKTPDEKAAWKRFLEEFNDLCSNRGGVPLLNQTPYLTREQVRRAYGEQLTKFEAARRRFDPEDRMLNAYFADFLGPAPTK
jgi:FAD/FMN-containing dehydrogenase